MHDAPKNHVVKALRIGSRLRSCWQAVAAPGLWLLMSALPAFAQPYAIDWFTLDGGGGTSTGGVYAVRGTIGQPDAGPTSLTGGPYSLSGGFWTISAVQTPGAPLLSIVRTSTNTVAVFWPSPSTGWVLQQNAQNLGTPNWSNVPGAPIDNGTNRTVIVNPPVGHRFYRLFKP
ncbi:MAG TPA: hypothetical protein PLV05_12810 [Verrucomicrobiota bacterium]|jgi:hypothetical protein|nr:hypothetical protein [Verrucomicrobiota bacterium]OQC23984.1 MAG: hypothetical protein BWX68_02490 [Verrucomicrobia bacterium ADurb.Bin063]HRR65597.1 hypothetical protein [Candidatus Paceibacterota bacterium]MBP8015754.1 hypothetical protein [Verrucomicrobiota bacterium]MDI9373521.1 hypothetical protein [Verrucomicrobiota bacterium]